MNKIENYPIFVYSAAESAPEEESALKWDEYIVSMRAVEKFVIEIVQQTPNRKGKVFNKKTNFTTILWFFIDFYDKQDQPS